MAWDRSRAAIVKGDGGIFLESAQLYLFEGYIFHQVLSSLVDSHFLG